LALEKEDLLSEISTIIRQLERLPLQPTSFPKAPRSRVDLSVYRSIRTDATELHYVLKDHIAKQAGRGLLPPSLAYLRLPKAPIGRAKSEMEKERISVMFSISVSSDISVTSQSVWREIEFARAGSSDSELNQPLGVSSEIEAGAQIQEDDAKGGPKRKPTSFRNLLQSTRSIR
jgi:hypothetical protein